PKTDYSGAASFTYSITDANGGSSSASVGLVVNVGTSETLFSPSLVPSIVTVADTNSVELGFKFQADTNGEITGIRFYKGSLNVGTHIADLWSSTGTLLATATFTNETASGWQQVNFSNPVAITAGTTYVASYHTNGDYSADPNYFSTSHVSGDLTAPSGSNGVYAYGSGGLFPSNSFNSTSYGVDVVFQPIPGPQANADSGFAVNENSTLSIAASALLANDTDPNGLPLSITGVSNPTNGTVSYNASTQTVTFVPNTGYSGAANFTYSISDANGGSSSASVGLVVNAIPQPLANADSGFVVNENTTLSIAASALLANDTDPNGLPLSITGVSNPTNGTVSYNASTQTVTFVPNTDYSGAASFTYSITDANGGSSSASVGLVVNVGTSETQFSPSSVPSIVTVADTNSVEL